MTLRPQDGWDTIIELWKGGGGGGEGKKGGTEVREKIRKKYRGKGLGLVVKKTTSINIKE